jgi:hypothetical protein
MKMFKSTILSLLRPLVLLAVASSFLFTGCEKDLVLAPVEETSIEAPIDFRAALLSMAYGMTAEQMATPEADELYAKITSGLTEAQQQQLEGMAEQYFARPQGGSESAQIGLRSLQESTLSSGSVGDSYGASVAKASGSLFVGAPGANRVYRYTQGDGGTYTLAQTLPGRNGIGTKIAAAGNWMGAASSGSQVTMYKNMGSYWSLAGIISTGLSFHVDIAMDGDRMAVMGGVQGVGERIIKVYARNGNTWSAEATIILDDVFFWDIDISGSTIVGNGGTNSDAGVLFSPQVYVFNQVGGAWPLAATLPMPGAQLSRAVAIDGGTIVANTFFFAFQFSNQTTAFTGSGSNWVQSGLLLQPLPVPFVQTRWLDIQGDLAVVTLPTDDFGPVANDAAHVFNRSGSAWSLVGTLTPSTGGLPIQYGASIVLDGGEVVIGGLASPGFGEGKAFVYQ